MTEVSAVYVRINLLPRELRPKKTLLAIDFRVVFTLLVIVAAVALGWYYYSLDTEIRRQQSDLENWRQQEALLADAVALQNEVNDLRDQVARRIAVIRDLTGDSDLRFGMLQYLNDITPENLWLQRISEREDGGVISFMIEGMSYSKEDISVFLARLQEYEHFQRVALESIRPAPLEIRDAYQYSVMVDLKSQGGDTIASADAGAATAP